MRNSTKVVAALGAAALVAAGGAAYTAANSVPGTTTQGYGATTVTGVTVATMAVNPATNPTNLSTIVRLREPNHDHHLHARRNGDDGEHRRYWPHCVQGSRLIGLE